MNTADAVLIQNNDYIRESQNVSPLTSDSSRSLSEEEEEEDDEEEEEEDDEEEEETISSNESCEDITDLKRDQIICLQEITSELNEEIERCSSSSRESFHDTDQRIRKILSIYGDFEYFQEGQQLWDKESLTDSNESSTIIKHDIETYTPVSICNTGYHMSHITEEADEENHLDNTNEPMVLSPSSNEMKESRDTLRLDCDDGNKTHDVICPTQQLNPLGLNEAIEKNVSQDINKNQLLTTTPRLRESHTIVHPEKKKSYYPSTLQKKLSGSDCSNLIMSTNVLQSNPIDITPELTRQIIPKNTIMDPPDYPDQLSINDITFNNKKITTDADHTLSNTPNFMMAKKQLSINEQTYPLTIDFDVISKDIEFGSPGLAPSPLTATFNHSNEWNTTRIICGTGDQRRQQFIRKLSLSNSSNSCQDSPIIRSTGCCGTKRRVIKEERSTDLIPQQLLNKLKSSQEISSLGSKRAHSINSHQQEKDLHPLTDTVEDKSTHVGFNKHNPLTSLCHLQTTHQQDGLDKTILLSPKKTISDKQASDTINARQYHNILLYPEIKKTIINNIPSFELSSSSTWVQSGTFKDTNDPNEKTYCSINNSKIDLNKNKPSYSAINLETEIVNTQQSNDLWNTLLPNKQIRAHSFGNQIQTDKTFHSHPSIITPSLPSLSYSTSPTVSARSLSHVENNIKADISQTFNSVPHLVLQDANQLNLNEFPSLCVTPPPKQENICDSQQSQDTTREVRPSANLFFPTLRTRRHKKPCVTCGTYGVWIEPQRRHRRKQMFNDNDSCILSKNNAYEKSRESQRNAKDLAKKNANHQNMFPLFCLCTPRTTTAQPNKENFNSLSPPNFKSYMNYNAKMGYEQETYLFPHNPPAWVTNVGFY